MILIKIVPLSEVFGSCILNKWVRVRKFILNAIADFCIEIAGNAEL